MKKIFVLAVIAVLAISTAWAATPPMKYQGEINAGYALCLDSQYTANRIILHTIHGVKIGDYFSTGLGVGAELYHDAEILIVPIYLNLKGYLPLEGAVVPYLNADFGYGACVLSGNSGVSSAAMSGLYYTVGLGVKFGKIKLEAGYNCQKVIQNMMGLNSIKFTIGFVF